MSEHARLTEEEQAAWARLVELAKDAQRRTEKRGEQPGIMIGVLAVDRRLAALEVEVRRLRTLLREAHHELTMVDGLLGVRDVALLQTLAYQEVFVTPLCQQISAALDGQQEAPDEPA